jgi:hypothetical protein
MTERRSPETSTLLIALLCCLVALPLAAQSRPTWSSAVDIGPGIQGSINGSVVGMEAARASIVILPDDDATQRTVVVRTDTLVTRYHGFGAGPAEIFTGNAGFNQIRMGDRLQARGVGRGDATIDATDVVLVGRSVPDAGRETTLGGLTGVVRSRSGRNSFTIDTGDSRSVIIFGSDSTPVRYRGGTYRISNIEIGDEVRVEVDQTLQEGVRPRAIEVIRSISDGARQQSRTLGSTTGRIVSIDRQSRTFQLDRGRDGVITIDAVAATDRDGREFDIAGLMVGDLLDITGEAIGDDRFRAGVIRFPDERGGGTATTAVPAAGRERAAVTPRPLYSLLVVNGTITGSLDNAGFLEMQDEGGRVVRVIVDESFVIRLRNGRYANARDLRAGTPITLRAFRDDAGNLIAQTIRVR